MNVNGYALGTLLLILNLPLQQKIGLKDLVDGFHVGGHPYLLNALLEFCCVL